MNEDGQELHGRSFSSSFLSFVGTKEGEDNPLSGEKKGMGEP